MAEIAKLLPLLPLMPTSSSSSHDDDIKVIAFKTVPSASKVEIKHALESFHGLQVQKVRTLNVKGKTTGRSGSLVAKPDYKKAYVTFKKPISFSEDLSPVHITTNTSSGKDNYKNKKMLVKAS